MTEQIQLDERNAVVEYLSREVNRCRNELNNCRYEQDKTKAGLEASVNVLERCVYEAES